MGGRIIRFVTNLILPRPGRYPRGARFALLFAVVAAAPVWAIDLQLGNLSGSFDSQVQYGVVVRTESNQDLSQSGSFGRRALFQNAGDIVSHQIKASHELGMSNSAGGDGNWGFFLRGNYFWDFEMMNQPLLDAAANRAERHGDLTDGFIWMKFGPAHELTLRAGKQVISWGESIFYQGAIADINTVDFTQLRSPGSALKDAFVGSQALYAQWQMNDAISLESFYLIDFQEIILDPAGSFFSTNDRIRDGGGFANGARSTAGVVYDNCAVADGGRCGFGPITRLADNLPGGSGGWGVAAHYFAPNFLTGFDFGFYYQNMSDHSPYLSTIVGGTACEFGPGLNGLCPKYFLDFPEDVERYGVSFNTNVKGWALSGELMYRRNAPTQNNVAFAAAVAGFPAALTALPQGFPNPVLGPVGPGAYGGQGTEFEGFERYKHYQFLFGFQRVFGPLYAIGAESSGILGEVAVGWARDLPKQNAFYTDFNPRTRDWWGFQVRGNIDYSRALFNLVNVSFQPAFQWDVHGVSPEVSPLFVDDRKRATMGVRFDWLNQWEVNISHTWEIDGDDVTRAPPPFSNGGFLFRPEGDFFRANISYSF